MCEYCSCDPCQCEVACPCGCGNSPLENCVYDTPLQRHEKNLINVLDDEQWVIDGMKAAQQKRPPDVAKWGCKECGFINFDDERACFACGSQRR